MAQSILKVIVAGDTRGLTTAMKQAEAATGKLATASKTLDAALLGQREAALKLEEMQARLSRATVKYGEDSLQARKAALALERAQGEAAVAVDRLKVAQTEAAAGAMKMKTAQKEAAVSSVQARTSFLGAGEGALKAAKGMAAMAVAYAGVSAVKDSVDATVKLGETTLLLHKNFGLAVHTASQWAAITQSRGVDGAKMAMGFKALATATHGAAAAAATMGNTHAAAAAKSLKLQIAQTALAQATAKYGANSLQALKATSALDKAQTTAPAKVNAQMKAFQALGISQQFLTKHGNDMQAVISKVSDGMAKMPPGTDRAALAAKLFGRTWQTLMPLLRDGHANLNKTLALTDKYGASLSGNSVKSVEKLIVAHREQKLAMMGIQVQLGQVLIPLLTKASKWFAEAALTVRKAWPNIKAVIGPVIDFITGGFKKIPAAAKIAAVAIGAIALAVASPVAAIAALAAGAIWVAANWKKVKPEFEKVKKAVVNFVGSHVDIERFGKAVSNVGKVVSTVMAVVVPAAIGIAKSVFGALKSWITSVVGVISGALNVITSLLTGDFAGAWKGIKQIVSSALKGVVGIITNITAPIRSAAADAASGIWKGIESVASTVVSTAENIGKSIVTAIVDGIKSAPGAIVDAVKSLVPGPLKDALGAVGGLASSIFGASGGVAHPGGFRKYAAGGVVPAMVSPGELVSYGNSAWTVPGAREPRDSVFAMLPVGAEVYTDHGQSLLANGASREQALAMQSPHFAAGGTVTASEYGGSDGDTIGSTKYGWAELSNPPGSLNFSALGNLPRGTNLRIGYRGREIVAPKVDVGAGGAGLNGHIRAIDLTQSAARKLSFNGLGDVQYSVVGRGATAADGRGATAAAVGRGAAGASVRFGTPYLDDARAAGYDAALQGARSVSGSLLRSIIAGAIGSRVQASTSAGASGSRVQASTSAGASGSASTGGTGTTQMDGKPVATWIARILQTARAAGTSFQVNSGFRSYAEQVVLWNRYNHDPRRVARPGTSNHEGSTYPRGAVDLSPGWQNMVAYLGKHPSIPLRHYGYALDPYHFSARGNRKGGVIRMASGGIAGMASGGRLGKLVSAATAPGATDGAAISHAMAALASRLADTTRTGWTALAHIISAATAAAASDRHHHNLAGSRREDAIANLGRATQGVRLGITAVNATSALTNVGRTDQITDVRNRIRGVDPASAIGLGGVIWGASQSIYTLGLARPALVKAIARAKKLHDEKTVAKLTDSLGQLDDGIRERQATMAEAARALPSQQAAERIDAFSRKLSFLSVDEATAAATPDGQDNRDVAGRKLGILQDEAGAVRDEIAKALARGDQAGAAGMADTLAQILGEIKTTNDTLTAQSDTSQALKDIVAEQVANQKRLIQLVTAQSPSLIAAVTATVSGDIGGKVGLGAQTPQFPGIGVRY